MKKINIILGVLILALSVVGCETYDDYDTDRDAIIGFVRKTQNINSVPVGGEKSTTLDIYITETSNQDRTFQIVDIRDASNPNLAGEQDYVFDSTVTIPANENIGTIEVTAIDVTLSPDGTSFALQVLGTDSPKVIAGNKVTINMKRRE